MGDFEKLYGAPLGVFDPEGSGYDERGAVGITPDPVTGHGFSRNAKTGQMLKGRSHPTWNLGVAGETKAGYQMYKGKDNKYYSTPSTKPNNDDFKR